MKNFLFHTPLILIVVTACISSPDQKTTKSDCERNAPVLGSEAEKCVNRVVFHVTPNTMVDLSKTGKSPKDWSEEKNPPTINRHLWKDGDGEFRLMEFSSEVDPCFVLESVRLPRPRVIFSKRICNFTFEGKNYKFDENIDYSRGSFNFRYRKLKTVLEFHASKDQISLICVAENIISGSFTTICTNLTQTDAP